MNNSRQILAPLRGVTTRSFRLAFAQQLTEAGFDEAVTPFIPASSSYDVLRDRELEGGESIFLTPQFIGKDPYALKESLKRILDAGYKTADLNVGCPYPMVRNKGRGAGLLANPSLLESMIEGGCSIMGEGCFSIKTRLGINSPDELFKFIDVFNRYPLRFITVHSRTAKQMYEGSCDIERLNEIIKLSKIPIVANGDIQMTHSFKTPVMIGRAFVRHLGERNDANILLMHYKETLLKERFSSNAVLGKLKELLSYWRHIPRWNRLWPVLKLSRALDEFTV